MSDDLGVPRSLVPACISALLEALDRPVMVQGTLTHILTIDGAARRLDTLFGDTSPALRKEALNLWQSRR